MLLSSCGKGLEVEFNVDGNVYLTQKLHKGDKLEDIEEPKKKGYTFEGWYLDGEKYPLDKPIEENISLEAVFTKNKYTVIFNDESGEENSQTIEYGDKVTKPEDPIKEDYAFLGWFNGDTEYDFNEPVTGDLNLIPKWVKNKASYTVEHYLMGLDGKYSDKAYKKEKYKGTIGKTVKPAVKSFKGFTSPSIKVIEGLEDNKLIIKYYYIRNKYDLTVTGDKGILETNGSGKYYYGENVKISAVVKDGYTFKKWSNGTKKITFTYNVSDNNAKFEALTTVNTYDISYELNGGTLNNKNDNYTVEDEITFEIPSKLGYTFTGWLLNGKKFNGTIKAGTIGDLNVEATFKPNENTKYVIQYYLMDTTGENYILDETRTLNKTGITDSKIEYTPEDIEGFAKPVLKDQYNQEVDLEDLVIEADESTVLKYYYERNKYDLTLTFDNGIESASGAGKYYFEQEIDLFYKLMPGYSFKSYSENVKNNVFKMPAKDVTINLESTPNLDTKYIVKHYKMNLNGNYEKVEPEVEEFQGPTDTQVTPNVKKYIGFTAPEKVSVNINGDGSTIVEYKYSRNKYEVIFKNDNPNRNVHVKKESYYFEEKIIQPIFVGWEHHDFLGWYIEQSDESLDGEWKFDEDTMPASNLTLRANWKIHDGTLNFVFGFKDFDSGNEAYFQNVTYDTTIKNVLEDNNVSDTQLFTNPTHKGYKFLGWYTSSSFRESQKISNILDFRMPDANGITLYAKWEPIEYTVEFVPNCDFNGENHKQKITYDDPDFLYHESEDEKAMEFPLDKNIYYKKGYTFLGWSKSENADNVDFVDEALVSNLTDQDEIPYKLYAVWQANEYTVTYDKNKGNGSTNVNGEVSSTTHTYDNKDNLSQDKYSREGYTFLGWSITQHKNSVNECTDCITKANNLATGEENDKNVTLYAVWKANEYTVTYDSNKGNGSSNPTGTVKTTNHIYDNKNNLSQDKYSREGYTFLGWSKTQHKDSVDTDICTDCITEAYNLASDDNANVTLYAVWKANEYIVTYDSNVSSDSVSTPKGIVNSTSHTYDNMKSLTTDVYTRDGYKFLGWSLNKNHNDLTSEDKCPDCIINADNLATSGEVTVYAVWGIVNYTITYNDLKMNTSTEYYNIEQDVILPIRGIMAGYDFEGWFEDNNFSGSEIKTITKGTYGNKTYYAKRTGVHYEVIYSDESGNTTSEDFVYGTEHTAKGPLTFTKQYEITYNANGGTYNEVQPEKTTVKSWKIQNSSDEITYESGKTISDLVIPTTKGQSITLVIAEWNNPSVTLPIAEKNNPNTYLISNFDGWYSSDVKQKDSIIVTGNIVLDARWNNFIDTDQYINDSISNQNYIDSTLTGTTINSNILSVNEKVSTILTEKSAYVVNARKLLNTPGVESVSLVYNGVYYNLTSDNVLSQMQAMLEEMTSSSKESNKANRRLSSLYNSTSPKKFTIIINADLNSTIKTNNTRTISYTTIFNSNNIITNDMMNIIADNALESININNHYIVSVDKNNLITLTYKDPSAHILVIDWLSWPPKASGELSGAGIKTAFWYLLGNTNEANTYPATFISSLDVTLYNTNGRGTNINIKPENVTDKGMGWQLFGFSLQSKLESAFQMSTNDITNSDLERLTDVNPFKISLNLDTSKMALEDNFSVPLSFTLKFVQSN